jgi:hypothetical protein
MEAVKANTSSVHKSQVEPSSGADPVQLMGLKDRTDPNLFGPILPGNVGCNPTAPIIMALETKLIQARENLEGGGFCSESSEDVSMGSPSNS